MDKNITRFDKKARSSGTKSFKTEPFKIEPFKLLQITDCHLGSEPNTTLLGMDTDLGLHDVLGELKRQEEPDMLLVTGDISNDGGPVSYARFLSIVDQYFPDTPLAWLPGNHDDPDNMIAVGQYPIEQSSRARAWHCIYLNSRIPGEEGGGLGEHELKRLERELEQNPETPTAIFLHHQPVLVGSAWIDQYIVKDADAFFEITDKHPQVKLISWGHVHQDFVRQRNGVSLIATPSTCIQFLPNSDDFLLDTTMPGYRYYGLNTDGTFETRVGRCDSKAYTIDMTATGY